METPNRDPYTFIVYLSIYLIDRNSREQCRGHNGAFSIDYSVFLHPSDLCCYDIACQVVS